MRAAVMARAVLLDRVNDRWLIYRSDWVNQFVLQTAPASLR
jgi:hypothetical protein